MECFSLKHTEYFYIDFREHKISTIIVVPRVNCLDYNTRLIIIWSLDTCFNNGAVYRQKTKAAL